MLLLDPFKRTKFTQTFVKSKQESLIISSIERLGTISRKELEMK